MLKADTQLSFFMTPEIIERYTVPAEVVSQIRAETPARILELAELLCTEKFSVFHDGIDDETDEALNEYLWKTGYGYFRKQGTHLYEFQQDAFHFPWLIGLKPYMYDYGPMGQEKSYDLSKNLLQDK